MKLSTISKCALRTRPPSNNTEEEMLVLAVGDAYIPERAISIPEKLQRLLVPGRIAQVVTLGNVSNAVIKDLLRPIAPVKSVSGTFDTENTTEMPFTTVLEVSGLRIGLVSSFTVIPTDDPDALLTIARKLDVDILLWGGAKTAGAYELAGKFFVTPGSISGAFPTIGADASTTPSFCLIDAQKDGCTVYFHSLQDDQVKVEKVAYTKEPLE